MRNGTSEKQAPEIVDAEPQVTMSMREVVPMAEIRDFFDRSFTMLAEVIERQELTIVAPAHAMYRGAPGETADVEVGFRTEPTADPEGLVMLGRLPGGRVARAVHVGNYERLSESWERLRAWVDDEGLVPTDEFWEVYLTEPTPDADPDDMRTELNWLLGD
ncbi:GyrI-like domain-containing protein [Ilumatobacter nonamiensis]|uniref:GyrI-like domain-containing protein n=1 Tax=Ilumatobacter nonamiensis TaxID=467093 RepID=UPI000345A46D|nr:GyrI-like domain-containing protein [Ilumatobacter nonamiensis]